MLAYGVCIGSRERYEKFAAPRLRDLGGVVVEADDQRSICAAYNAILDAVADEPDVEGLVLLHEDVTIESAAFIAAIRAELADPDVAVVGAIGSLRPSSLRWWQAEGRGRVRDSTGLVDFGGGRHDVDVLDGLCLVLSPWAIRHLRFDDSAFHGFHGYDSDICLQARAAGKRVRVTDLPITHHTHGGYGDAAAYARASAAFGAKWRELLFALQGVRAPAPASCAACGGIVATVPATRRLEVAACARCGSGLTLPVTTETGAPEPSALAAAAATARADWIERAGARRVALFGGDAALADELRRRGIETAEEHADAAVVVGAFERAPDAAAVARQARAVLAPGGLLLAECRNFAAVEAAVDPIVWGRPDLADLRTLLTPAGARALLERNSFTAVETSVATSEAYDPPELWRARRDHWASMRLGADSENVLLVRGRAA
jgi:SAM-dependent methyltransferase